MKISVLASGSKGNSTYIESEECKILIDAGVSAKKIQHCLEKIGRGINEIDAIFVTHEHIDHVRALPKLNTPIYINKLTYESLRFELNEPNFFSKKFKFNDLTITPIPVMHDAANPFGFKIQSNGVKLGIFTDLGKATNNVVKVIKEVDSLVLEANHDIDMLINGPYPYHLKQRILSDKGHLSNIEAALSVKDATNMKTIFLAHLSQNNNTKELAYDTFTKITNDNIDKILTDQDEVTELLNLNL